MRIESTVAGPTMRNLKTLFKCGLAIKLIDECSELRRKVNLILLPVVCL